MASIRRLAFYVLFGPLRQVKGDSSFELRVVSSRFSLIGVAAAAALADDEKQSNRRSCCECGRGELMAALAGSAALHASLDMAQRLDTVLYLAARERCSTVQVFVRKTKMRSP
ncbi:hypothetical protein OUZ56_023023 [Daphnia magna]|uniref:Secreted protein n=1 Tax=Daphnia magna TaxID=35525 RepID=A0ABR0AY45_9CRUS|nr:hypothetical protein OUZ56_023023 [Daphnia magna]